MFWFLSANLSSAWSISVRSLCTFTFFSFIHFARTIVAISAILPLVKISYILWLFKFGDHWLLFPLSLTPAFSAKTHQTTQERGLLGGRASEWRLASEAAATQRRQPNLATHGRRARWPEWLGEARSRLDGSWIHEMVMFDRLRMVRTCSNDWKLGEFS